MKAMQRGPAAAAEPYRPELLADEEPRYLRRQKPLEIRRKKFGGQSWPFYRRVLVWTVTGAATVTFAVIAGRFLLYSPQVLLLKPEQIELRGNHIVSREAVLQPFARDRNRSVLRIPLEIRRTQLEELPWVESASVQRILPNHIRVELTERTPVAFLRSGTELALIDAHGVILDRPEGENFHFPIVTGLPDSMPQEEREKRMQTYQEFLTDLELVRSGSTDHVSEVDLSNAKDVRVVMTGLASAADPQAVTVHFGNSDFTGKYRMLVDNFAQWQANAGRVQSIDLQYSRQVVVNSDSSASSAKPKN
ncbi:MAG TPA: FtsQ-type POTRA domain-containing protein [Candidatus Solibacter sp.]|nr:FtsQ-type POTRA domain-containing protein [Candidatus Solibacter sp.]